jgi:hypothetical protein
MGLVERKSGIATALNTSLTQSMGASSAKAVLQAYGITPTTSDDSAMQSIVDLATDIAYYAPALCFARSWPGRTYYYHFNEPNPWQGAFKGCSTHMLDAAYLFQNFAHKMGSKEKELGVALAMDFIKFTNGVKPWDEYESVNCNVKAFGPSEATSSRAIQNNGWGHGRRDILFTLQEAGKVDLDALSGAWDLFIAGK